MFLLRLFNDCFAVLALLTSIYFYQRRIWTVGSVAYSFGVGIKMSLLLAAPAIGLILLQALPFKRAMNAAFLMAQVQVSSFNQRRTMQTKLTLCNRSPLPFHFYRLTRKATSHGHLSSLGNSCSNGPSTGDLWGKRDFYPGNSL